MNSKVAENEEIPTMETGQAEESNAQDCKSEVEVEGAEEDKMAEDATNWQEKYVRLAADFDNFRKRTIREKMELVEYSGQEVIKLMLSVLDDMDRAVVANEAVEDPAVIREGMSLIRQKMVDSLKQREVTEIEAIGEKLDTDLHDAIAKFPVEDEAKKGCVIDVLEKGYKLKDKVVRFSKVVVGE